MWEACPGTVLRTTTFVCCLLGPEQDLKLLTFKEQKDLHTQSLVCKGGTVLRTTAFLFCLLGPEQDLKLLTFRSLVYKWD